MEIIPLIHFKKHKIYTKTDSEQTTIEEFIDKYPKIEQLYILDHDGIEKDKPNLCSFPKLSEKFETWIDSRPMVLGDVVDIFMAGGYAVTLRKNLWEKLDVDEIREISENKIYAHIDLTQTDNENVDLSVFNRVDGMVIFNDKEQVQQDITFSNNLKGLSSRYKTYIYESNSDNIMYWKDKGVTGLLVDIDTLEVFKKKWDLKQRVSSHLSSNEVEEKP